MAPQSEPQPSVDEMMLDIERRLREGEALLEECPDFRLGRSIRLGGGLIDIEEIQA